MWETRVAMISHEKLEYQWYLMWESVNRGRGLTVFRNWLGAAIWLCMCCVQCAPRSIQQNVKSRYVVNDTIWKIVLKNQSSDCGLRCTSDFGLQYIWTEHWTAIFTLWTAMKKEEEGSSDVVLLCTKSDLQTLYCYVWNYRVSNYLQTSFCNFAKIFANSKTCP